MNLRALFGTTKLATAKVEREERFQEADEQLRTLAATRVSLREDLSAALHELIKEKNQ